MRKSVIVVALTGLWCPVNGARDGNLDDYLRTSYHVKNPLNNDDLEDGRDEYFSQSRRRVNGKDRDNYKQSSISKADIDDGDNSDLDVDLDLDQDDFDLEMPSMKFFDDDKTSILPSSLQSDYELSETNQRSNFDRNSKSTRGDDKNQSKREALRKSEVKSPFNPNKHVMYDAYNQLHTLAQDFNKPFDAPAVVVVGHQSSGKSALIEALMGFQFNQVGGGTKTRRPVALRLQYNPECHEPKWFLVGDDGVERPVSLAVIQEYIERENRKLELDPSRSFDSREINIRMEYKHCPNMILIDTPGLISAPRVPKGTGASDSAVAQQRALLASAKEVEKLVIEKMRCEDYIILCVEDTSDWKHGVTREVVQKADPDLSRTVIVNTKFDTKLPQFGSPSDVEDFLRAPILDRIVPQRLGGPFFTSVPSGRVGRAHDKSLGSDDYMFENDEDFVNAVAAAESTDQSVVLKRLKRNANQDVQSFLGNRIGMRRLRKFLEERVDECYKKNVQKIIPMLQADYSVAERRLRSCEKELEALSADTLRLGAETFVDDFCQCLRTALKGTIVAPVSVFGETLDQEYSVAGSFHAVKGSPMAVSDRTWERLVEAEVGNINNRLYGGSQYHRALREFHLAAACLRLPTVTDDEIANAAGLGETHDGVNYLHAACVIAVEKARLSFDPMIRALQMRLTHIMDRLCPVAEYMLSEKRERARQATILHDSDDVLEHTESSFGAVLDVSQNPSFRNLVRTIFEKFVRKCAESAITRSRDDLHSITRYVTWNLNERGSNALSRALPDSVDVISIYRVAVENSGGSGGEGGEGVSTLKVPSLQGKKEKETAVVSSKDQALVPLEPQRHRYAEREYRNLLNLMEETFVAKDIDRTNLLVGSLVQHIVTQWRLQFCNSVITKFNCYFMMPFVDEFDRHMRRELQALYDGQGSDLSDVFDVKAARRALEKSRDELYSECMANKQLQDKFKMCSNMLAEK